MPSEEDELLADAKDVIRNTIATNIRETDTELVRASGAVRRLREQLAEAEKNEEFFDGLMRQYRRALRLVDELHEEPDQNDDENAETETRPGGSCYFCGGSIVWRDGFYVHTINDDVQCPNGQTTASYVRTIGETRTDCA